MNRAQLFASATAGILFGLGLAISGLGNPEKVLQFLTINDQWSPALLFTMAAGIAVTWLGYRRVLAHKPVLEEAAHLPTNRTIDRPLILGAVVFGLGWGLAGYCPGPAFMGLVSGSSEPLWFVAAMVLGLKLQQWLS